MLTRHQDFLYRLLLQEGSMSLRVLESKSGFNKVLLSEIILQLNELNLIEEKSNLIRAIYPDEVLEKLFVKKNSIDLKISEFQATLKAYEIYKKDSDLPRVHFWRGLESMSVVYEEALKSDVWRGIVNIDEVFEEFEEYLDKIAEALSSKKVEARDLLLDTKIARDYKKQYQKGTYQIKLFQSSENLQFDVIILRDKVFFLSFIDSEMLVIEIESRMIVESQLLMFDFMWNNLK